MFWFSKLIHIFSDCRPRALMNQSAYFAIIRRSLMHNGCFCLPKPRRLVCFYSKSAKVVEILFVGASSTKTAAPTRRKSSQAWTYLSFSYKFGHLQSFLRKICFFLFFYKYPVFTLLICPQQVHLGIWHLKGQLSSNQANHCSPNHKNTAGWSGIWTQDLSHPEQESDPIESILVLVYQKGFIDCVLLIRHRWWTRLLSFFSQTWGVSASLTGRQEKRWQWSPLTTVIFPWRFASGSRSATIPAPLKAHRQDRKSELVSPLFLFLLLQQLHRWTAEICRARKADPNSSHTHSPTLWSFSLFSCNLLFSLFFPNIVFKRTLSAWAQPISTLTNYISFF